MKDPLGAVVSELATAGIASGRVRGSEPAPGDALGPGQYQRFVVVSNLGRRRFGIVPVQDERLGIRAYGVTASDAAALWGEISDFLNARGGRAVGTRYLHQSMDDGESSGSKDPDTEQPYESGVITVLAATGAAA